MPTQSVLDNAAEALRSNHIEVIIVGSVTELKSLILATIPKGSEIFTISSETLRLSGIAEAINESGDYISVRNQLNEATDKQLKRKLGASPDWAIGSVQAVTEDGHLWIVSATGSQLASCVYGAEHVIYVVGQQKIVKDDATAMQRIYEVALPLESQRSQKIYHKPSKVGKILQIIDDRPGRTTVYIVKENIGF
jgi:hypothetical protein